MKKMMLGVLALSSMASLAAGYVRTNSEAKIYNDKLTTEGIKTPGYEVKPNLELGVLFGENKEGFIFAGGQLSLGKENGNGKKLKTNKNFYLGSRIDTNVAENTNLKLTFLYDKQAKDKDKKFIERLKEQGKWDNKLKTDDEKENHLYLNGYKLFDKNNTLLISSVLSGKNEEYLGENLEYHVGAIYGSKDFTNNTFESFAKAKVNFAKYNLEGNLTSTLGTYKRYKINEKKYQLIEEKDVKSGNLANGGRLSADLKVSSDKLVDKLTLSAKGYTTLDTVLLDKKQQLIKAGLETEAKYKLDAVELKANLNYGTEVINKETPTEVKLLHKPKVVLGAKYTGVEKLMLSTELSDEVFIKQEVKTPVAKKDIANKFVVKNTAEYELLKGVKLGAIANYKLETTFDQVAHKHMVVAGPHLNVKIEDEVKKVNSDVRLRYGLEAENKDLKHYVGLYSDTKGEYKLNDTIKLEGSLKADTLLRIRKGDWVINLETLSYVHPEFKISYEKDRFSASANANDALTIQFNKTVFGNNVYISNNAKLGAEVGYKVVDNVKVIGGLELSHIYFGDQKDNNKELHKLVSKLDEFKFTSSDFKAITAKHLHVLNIEPSVSVKASLVNDKLTLEPKISSEIKFASETNTFKLNSVEGKASLKVEYKW